MHRTIPTYQWVSQGQQTAVNATGLNWPCLFEEKEEEETEEEKEEVEEGEEEGGGEEKEEEEEEEEEEDEYIFVIFNCPYFF